MPISLLKLQRCGNPAPIQAADKRYITNQATPQVLQEGLPLLPKPWDHLRDPFKAIQFTTRTIHPKSRSSAPSVEVIILMARSTRHEQMTVGDSILFTTTSRRHLTILGLRGPE
ncbi:MAG: hypothetical protein LQ339_000691, partial [Xanthoria mediterranea]